MLLVWKKDFQRRLWKSPSTRAPWARRETEINFINGSWSRMGRKVGVKIPVNDQLVKQILEKCSSY
ncbi:Ketopantoate reductase ApbA/PanE [Penicillium manginii]|uniref:Ketopantoate reductase ApbA/PanE n=1 Tax=Penicillium manginii TaxID=203109 RepID=UPI0025490ADE|nr:Ketopantoate reductase ApbA/PanE [Penicillium manginii]KAJ5743984.1 Ketopantoate reductase ApbA/PanE [Penicillium manginii]